MDDFQKWNNLYSCDISHFLSKVSETLSNSNGHIQTYEESGGEDKPMLQVKMNGNDDQGINALINRQLQGKHTKST